MTKNELEQEVLRLKTLNRQLYEYVAKYKKLCSAYEEKCEILQQLNSLYKAERA